jgi:hypothetical protein
VRALVLTAADARRACVEKKDKDVERELGIIPEGAPKGSE